MASTVGRSHRAQPETAGGGPRWSAPIQITATAATPERAWALLAVKLAAACALTPWSDDEDTLTRLAHGMPAL